MASDDDPICRAAIRNGRVTLNAWVPGLIRGGPVGAALAHVDAALADLRVPEVGELVVTPVARVPWPGAAEGALLAWARLVGYRRVWLPERVVELTGELATAGVAAVDCPTCGARWEDGAIAFWEDVRASGWFPTRCLACGGSLPEWAPVEHAAAQDSCDRVRSR